MTYQNFKRGDASTILLIVILLIGFLVIGLYLSTYIPEQVPEGEEKESDNEAEEETVEISFTTLEQGSNGGLAERGALVVRDSIEWTKLKKELGSGILESKEVDIAVDTVLVAFFGEKNTGGYTIRIEKVEKSGDLTTVTIRETSPLSNCIVTQAFTTPYHIVTIPKTDDLPTGQAGQIKFVSVEDTISCN